MPDLRQRFDDFAARVGEAGHKRTGGGAPHAFDEDYWQSVRDLFTRDVTAEALRDLLQRDTRDAFHFFTRDVDFAPLGSKPWYKRYPLAAWRVFLAMAHRLSPGRRILFALGAPLLWLGWIWYVLERVTGQHVPYSFLIMLVSATLLFALLVMELRDKLALKGDLEIARQIQFGLLPFEPYDHGGVSIRASMRPANTVGGDYFDVIELGDGRTSVVMGDVAGKGMPAALLMALLQGSLRTLLTAGLRGSDLIAKLNAHLCANIPSNRLITLFYGELDAPDGVLRYVNAGHNPPLLMRRAGGIENLSATAVALGVMPDARFEAMETPLEPGDRLLLYTDGITEAMNAKDVEYGEERLLSFLQSRLASTHEELIEGLLADVLRFCGGVRPRDDMTLLVLGRES